jgi:hypothetical protein
MRIVPILSHCKLELEEKMKVLTTTCALTLVVFSSVAKAGPLDGIERNLDKNGAFSETDYGATTKPGGGAGNVGISDAALGVDSGRGGELASEKSVVTTTRDTNNETGTRVNFPD